MSMLPNVRARFDSDLSAEECKQIAIDIKKIKGVVSASFNAAAADTRGVNEFSVTYTQSSVPREIETMKGFEKFVPGYRF